MDLRWHKIAFRAVKTVVATVSYLLQTDQDYIIRKQRNCHLEGFDLPLHLP